MGPTIVRGVLVHNIIVINVSKVFLNFDARVVQSSLMLKLLLTFVIYLHLCLLVIFGLFESNRVVRAMSLVISYLAAGWRLGKLIYRIY